MRARSGPHQVVVRGKVCDGRLFAVLLANYGWYLDHLLSRVRDFSALFPEDHFGCLRVDLLLSAGFLTLQIPLLHRSEQNARGRVEIEENDPGQPHARYSSQKEKPTIKY